MVIQLAKTILQFQNENGSWSWLIMSPEKQKDSSTTAILSWFLANAASIPEISADCKLAQEKALQYLKKVTRRSGAVDFSQGDTKAIGVYSQQYDILPFTQGFCLRTMYKQ
jgi:unsaturated rhamnogalacturonyl hydrolase